MVFSANNITSATEASFKMQLSKLCASQYGNFAVVNAAAAIKRSFFVCD